LTEFIFGFTTNKWVVLLMLNVILLLMGMLVDDISGNILSAAILLPIAQSVGIDPIHFAAISVTNLSLGNITPPCAPMLYLAGLIGGNLPLKRICQTGRGVHASGGGAGDSCRDLRASLRSGSGQIVPAIGKVKRISFQGKAGDHWEKMSCSTGQKKASGS
jgi:hypothetical protein